MIARFRAASTSLTLVSPAFSAPLNRPATYFLAALLATALLATPVRADYSGHPSAEAFIAKMVDEHDFSREEVMGLLAGAERQQSILDAIARPAEKTKAWYEYRQIFLLSRI